MLSCEVVVIGGGHAGIEACLATSRLGLSTILVTSNLDRIGYMSCNPAIGGLAKGHMVREIDALGGEMGLATDHSTIQFKRLNATKGPAVRGSRSQCDKQLYSEYMKGVVQRQVGLKVIESEVKSLLLEGDSCHGVLLSDGSQISSRSVIVTTGTFMNAVMHMGGEQTAGGRAGDKATVGLSDQLRSYGFVVNRLKTGTPARLIADSIDWSKTTPQHGDPTFYPFSFRSPRQLQQPQTVCYLSYTNENTHDIIRKNLHLSPMYCGAIEGVGPRYCPSIEDKVTRFAEKASHQTFLEPEGLNTNLIYLQGISTSLPAAVQNEFLKTIPGLEAVKVARYGYAVEYDFVEPTQIQMTLESQGIDNLFLAGQINGTSGYEEAAAQGLWAGLNAAFKIIDRSPFLLRRDQAYMGVLIDDLVTKGTKEPYRMFTSRAEHRLVLREDNTLDRLSDVSEQVGLLGTETFSILKSRFSMRDDIKNNLIKSIVYPNDATNKILIDKGSAPLLKPASFEVLLRRPEISWATLEALGGPNFAVTDVDVFEGVEIDVKYSGYIKRQLDMIRQSVKMESLALPRSLNYGEVQGLSAEEREKLVEKKPETLGVASRISGVNPSAIQAILVYLKGHKSNTGTGDRTWKKQMRKSYLSGELRNGSPT